nr:50s ribosomal protein l6, chloroplastic [Quercus suber]
MASSLNSSFQTSNLRTVFLGKKNEVSVSSVPVNRVGFLRKTVVCKESRIGKQPIQVPSNVTITLEGQFLKVKGPLGELSQSYPREVNVEREEPGTLKVKKAMETRRANQMHGLFRTLTDNMVVGVSKGFEKKLQLIGVGYRAMLEGNDLVLNLGFSHPVRMAIPDGIKVKVEDNTRITVSGYDKSAIGQFAASVRRWRPPEPYKGFEKKLQLIGVGYRAMLEGNDLVLNLGFSHPVRMAIPDGIKVKVEDNTRITVSGYDKSAIGQFAASVRRWRPPEPYKGKGVKYADEIVRRKEGKAGKKK